ncbi:MAG: hypothetical protein EOO90_17075 [Pedobacter sp.]|nr:MAG: hypothetical protein EOO90_17075 [Pedobacter sp.]
MKFQEISEFEFKNGNRSSSMVLEIHKVPEIKQLYFGIFVHHAVERASASHLHINRYISAQDRDYHFLTVWSDKKNDYCEFIVHDYVNKTTTRYIPN